MFLRSKALKALLLVAVGSAAFAVTQGFATSFISAPAGTAVSRTAIALPAVYWQPGQPIPPALAATNGFTPGLDTLLSRELVITNERQMRYVWRVVFGTPYDATQFNFHDSFVIWVGGGELQYGGFDISSVERVDANYAGTFPTTGTDVDPFLAVTATTFIPGNPPVGVPPFYAVSAVKVPRTFFDDVVFHRTIFAAP
jgi:hypothetical protein